MFWHRKELVSSVYDHLTLAQMRIHTGFSFEAYDLVRPDDSLARRPLPMRP